MPIVDRPVDFEPEEKPDQLGRHLLRIKRDYPGQWREAFESHNRQHAVMVEGRLIGRGAGRIAGVTDISGWEARLVERMEGETLLYVVRVRYTEPEVRDAKAAAAKERAVVAVASGAGVEGVLTNGPRDPDEAATLGLDGPASGRR